MKINQKLAHSQFSLRTHNFEGGPMASAPPLVRLCDFQDKDDASMDGVSFIKTA
jgi:hypothetical protein